MTNYRMNPGKLRHRIQIYGKVKSTNESKKTVYVDDLIDTIYAEIIPQTGKLQNQQVDTILTNVTHKIVVRYNSGKDIKNNMYLMFNNHRFDIKYILNPYFRNETLEIFTEEVIG
jgi:SPP1 family predicted phage head-tail adaptor